MWQTINCKWVCSDAVALRRPQSLYVCHAAGAAAAVTTMCRVPTSVRQMVISHLWAGAQRHFVRHSSYLAHVRGYNSIQGHAGCSDICVHDLLPHLAGRGFSQEQVGNGNRNPDSRSVMQEAVGQRAH